MDIRTAFAFHPLHNNLKSEPKPAAPNNNNSSKIEEFQKLLADKLCGTIPAARRMSTTVFDNGQVMIDYITDCLPTSEAWMKVHAYQFNNGRFASPVLFNFTLPERYSDDSRWSTVRNTPLRKTIETIGSLLADIGVTTATYHAIRTSKNGD